MANAAARNKRQTQIKGATPVVGAETTKRKAKAKASPAAPQPMRVVSIRQLIRGHLLAGTPTKDIAADVQAKFPESAAAAKSSKHISYYASAMRKAGELPPVQRQISSVHQA